MTSASESHVTDQNRKRHLNGRLRFIAVLVLMMFGLLAFRLVQLQIIDASTYEAMGRKQRESTMVIKAERGTIFDRNGLVLASNAIFISYGIDPLIAGKTADLCAKRMARLTGKPEKVYLDKINPRKRYALLEKSVKPDAARLFDTAGLRGVIIQRERKRLYHYDEIGGQVVGFTNPDTSQTLQGVNGIEAMFDQALRGTDGFVVMQRDALRRRRESMEHPKRSPVNGNNVYLTIDIGYQTILQDELAKGVERAGAETGIAIMVQPVTGEILAMSHYPSINPNAVEAKDTSHMKVRAVTDMIEPGSVFKLVTAAAALEHHLIKPEQSFAAENGKYKVKLPGERFRLISDTHPYTRLTFQEGIEVSSNIVMAKASDIIGAERLYIEARNFGFGITSGIEIAGEASGVLKKPSEWSMTTLNSISFGYEVSVTPLQVAMAYAVVANGGYLMRPYLLSKIVDEDGNVIREGSPEVIRKVVSKETIDQLKNFLVGVIERGTGQGAKMRTVHVAGKTGTSRKYIGGEYQAETYNASFIGFFPAEKPIILCYVFLEKPRLDQYTGGMASAPIFKAIAERIINNKGLYSLTETQTPHDIVEQEMVVPNISNMKKDDASTIITNSGLHAVILGDGDVVVQQQPIAGMKVHKGTSVKIITSRELVATGDIQVPDLRGMSIRRAMNRLRFQRLDFVLHGSGVVVQQYPEPGSRIERSTKITLVCEPKAPMTTVLY